MLPTQLLLIEPVSQATHPFPLAVILLTHLLTLHVVSLLHECALILYDLLKDHSIVKVQSYSETPLYSRQDRNEHFCLLQRGVSNSEAPGTFPVGMVLCHWTVEHMQHGFVFRAIPCYTLTEKANKRLSVK